MVHMPSNFYTTTLGTARLIEVIYLSSISTTFALLASNSALMLIISRFTNSSYWLSAILSASFYRNKSYLTPYLCNLLLEHCFALLLLFI